MRYRFCSSLLALAFLIPGTALAQDSFFDIFTEVEVDAEHNECDECSALEQEIKLVQQQIDATKTQLSVIDYALTMLEGIVADVDKAVTDLEKQLEEMNNPKSWVESEGRRMDSSDQAALKRRNANLWKSYKGGRLSAEEYSEEIGKPFDDPEVAEDLKILKEVIKDEIRDRIKEMQKVKEEIKEQMAKLQDQAQDLTDILDELLTKLEKLLEQLDDCKKRCTEEPISIPEDYGYAPEGKGILKGVIDFIRGFFTPDDPALPELDEILRKIDDPETPYDDVEKQIDDFINRLGGTPDTGEGGQAEGTPPTTPNPFEGIDFKFDFDFDFTVPPVTCHLCDPLRAEIMEAEWELELQEEEMAQLEGENAQNWQRRGEAQKMLDAAKKALEGFNRPNASGESEGRRLDSNDLAAMRVRNARLWGEYKAGDLSAQELESEWGKDYTDPSVKAELDKIKDQMKKELEKAVSEAEAIIKQLDDAIAINDARQIELAGTIAARGVILEYLYKQLEECEKKCHMPVEEPAVSIGGYEKFIFVVEPGEEVPVNPISFGSEGSQASSLSATCTGDRCSEVINVPQECKSPAAPMSQCQQTCTETCTKSGVRAWQEGNTVIIEDCGICPPPHIDMCPNGMFFDKAECETAGKCECDEQGKSNDGAACYACKKKSQSFVCTIPLIGGWWCDDEQVEEDDGDGGMLGGEEQSSVNDQSSERSSLSASSKTSESRSQTSVSKVSSKVSSVATATCDEGTMTESACRASCKGTCNVSYEEFDGLKCYKCYTTTQTSSKQASSIAKEVCDAPTETEAECKKECFGTCSKVYTRTDGVKCFECVAEKSSSSSATSRTQTGPTCPSGTVGSKSLCEEECGEQGGTCKEQNGCYSCEIVNCPSGTYKNECPSSCASGCDVVGSQDGVSCYQCKQSCEDVCTDRGYDPPGMDYSSGIMSQLQAYTCVSGATVSLTTATIGSCVCTKQPSVSVNQTPPVCTGTTCGDVACGGSATCSPSPGTTVTVRCNWGGWKDLGNYKFQPVIGQ